MATAPTNLSRIKTASSKIVTSAPQGTGEPLIGGVDFWMIAGLALCLDFFQTIVLMGHVLATGLMAAASIPLIGWVLGVVTVPAGAMFNFGIMLIGLIFGLALTGTISLYCFFKKIPITFNRAGAEAFKFLLEQIPILNILPFHTINIILLRHFENKRRMGDSGFPGKAVSFIAHKIH